MVITMWIEDLLYQDFLKWLKEDILFFDITTKIIPEKCYKAEIIAKSDGIAVGLNLISKFLSKLGIECTIMKEDGETFTKGERLMLLKGDVRKILMVERTILNILCHLCGVAKAVREALEKAREVNPNVKIAATRKTIPGLRLLQKYAVEIAGGDTHRLSLSDMILIKDNHIRVLGGIDRALNMAKRIKSFAHKIEIEVTNIEDAVKAAKLGADIIMLDNMSPEEIKEVIKKLEQLGLRNKVILEASGGININNIHKYAETGIDVISMGSITHSIKACDISLEVIEEC